MFGFRKHVHANRVPGIASTENPDKKPEILSQQVLMMRPEIELDLIIELLERKLNTKFEKRIRLDGFIDEPEYRLVIENFGSNHPGTGVSVYGGSCENVLDVNRCFVKKYWEDNAKMLETDPETLDGWDRRVWEGRKAASVASSRDEMLLIASAEGLI